MPTDPPDPLDPLETFVRSLLDPEHDNARHVSRDVRDAARQALRERAIHCAIAATAAASEPETLRSRT